MDDFSKPHFLFHLANLVKPFTEYRDVTGFPVPARREICGGFYTKRIIGIFEEARNFSNLRYSNCRKYEISYCIGCYRSYRWDPS